MKLFSTILLLLLTRTAWPQEGQPNAVQRRIDNLEGRVIAILYQKTDTGIDTMALYVSQVLRESRQVNYIHGIAVALACQAFIMNRHANDFTQSERLARESLDWFGKTGNKYAITLAYYTLGFSLFAQSRFDEAIHNYEQAREYARRSGNCIEEVYMLSLTGEAYRERGNYEKAFDILRQCIPMAESLHNATLVKEQYFTLSGLFVQIEDYGSAEKYFRMGCGTDVPGKADPWSLMVYTELLTHQGKYDSALYYYGRFDSTHAKPAMLRTFLVSKGEYYMARGDYATALPYFVKSLSYQLQLNDRNQGMRCLQDMAKAYERLNRNSEALSNARECLVIAQHASARQYIRDGSQILSTLYDKEGRKDSAYFYYRRFISMKDSVLNDQLKGKFASYHFEQQIALLNKEKQLQDVCIREEMLTKKLLIGGLIALLLIGFIFSRYILLKRKNEAHRRKRAENELEIHRLEGEKARSALQQRAKELEIQALRSQMNPHFIFNCLNAINRFILGHETEAASDYLTKFSRLMRMIMNHSRHSVISLAEELEVLRLYLDMERLRFKDAFDYTIILDEEADASDIYIPPLLLQPFVENAVWHGLMHKQKRGSLTVEIHVENELLTCIIQDDGVGRTRAGTLKSKSAQKHKSMGLQITAERLALLTDKGAPGHFFDIEDLYDQQGDPAGTRVVLKIRISSPAGEFV